jgi:hypothetical protein
MPDKNSIVPQPPERPPDNGAAGESRSASQRIEDNIEALLDLIDRLVDRAIGRVPVLAPLLRQTSLQSSIARATYGSPLRRFHLGFLLGIVLPVVGVAMLLNSAAVRQSAPDWLYLIGLALVSAATYPAQLLLRALDSREPEPFWLVDGAKWYDTAAGLGIAALLDTIFQ